MAQQATFTWTNPAAAVARFQEIGFEPAHIVVMAISGTSTRFEWNDQMPAAAYYNSKTDTYTTTNGFTYVSNAGPAVFGSAVSAFTNANPGVITVADGSKFRVGDVINVTQLADDGAGTDTLNGQYTIASIAGNALTTTTNTTGYSAYVSGGVVYVYERLDINDDLQPVINDNSTSVGVTLGTGVVGGNSQVMVMTVWGKNNVT